MNGRTDLELTCVRFILSRYQTEERSFAGAVRTDHTDYTAGRKREFQLLKKQFVVITFGHAVRLDNNISEPRAGWNKDLEFVAAFLGFGRDHLLVIVDTRLRFRMTSFRRHPYPFKLALECLCAFIFGLLFLRETILFLLEPRRVIPFPRNSFTAIKLEDPTRDVVEEVSIVRDRDDGALVLLQMLLKPAYR